MIVLALDGSADPARMQALPDHLLARVEQNRRLHRLVARQPDNDAGWIPSERRGSATGFAVPLDTGASILGRE